MGRAGTELGVGESGAHSSVDLVGIKVKRNVSALSRPQSAAVKNWLGGAARPSDSTG